MLRQTIIGPIEITEESLGQIGEYATHIVAAKLSAAAGMVRVASKYGKGWGADAFFVRIRDGILSAALICESKVDGARLEPGGQLTDAWLNAYARGLHAYGWHKRAQQIEQCLAAPGLLTRKLFHFRSDDGSLRIWDVDTNGRCIPPRSEQKCIPFRNLLLDYAEGRLALRPPNPNE